MVVETFKGGRGMTRRIQVTWKSTDASKQRRWLQLGAPIMS